MNYLSINSQQIVDHQILVCWSPTPMVNTYETISENTKEKFSSFKDFTHFLLIFFIYVDK